MPCKLHQPLSAFSSFDVFTVRLRGTEVNGCIDMVMTLVSHAVQSARTYVCLSDPAVCFEICVYQRRLRNFRSRERRVQRQTSDCIDFDTDFKAYLSHQLTANIYHIVTYREVHENIFWKVCVL